MLDPGVYDRIQRLFMDRFASGEHSPAELTGEYRREEFLQVVDEAGQVSGWAEDLLTAYRTTSSSHSHFGAWFQEAVIREGEKAGQPILLAARWLCHVAGLRHGTVEIFIDPPDLDGMTLVQVRGMEKIEAPGTFDIPCAGHISGVDSAKVALWKELAEELNLSREDLQDLRLVCQYNSQANWTGQDPILNVEHRVLYRARLVSQALSRIRFSDGEVAGLGVFTVTELRELVRRFPERVARGLSDAMTYYH